MEEKTATQKAADLVKRALTVGVGAAFLTEESLRSLVGELKLPKELITNLLSTANQTKNEFFAKLSSELIDRLQDKIDIKELTQEILRNNDIEFTVKVKVTPKDKE